MMTATEDVFERLPHSHSYTVTDDRCVRHDCRRALAESRAECERLRSAGDQHFRQAMENGAAYHDQKARAERLAEALRNVLDSGSAIHTPAYEAARAALSLEPTP